MGQLRPTPGTGSSRRAFGGPVRAQTCPERSSLWTVNPTVTLPTETSKLQLGRKQRKLLPGKKGGKLQDIVAPCMSRGLVRMGLKLQAWANGSKLCELQLGRKESNVQAVRKAKKLQPGVKGCQLVRTEGVPRRGGG